MGEERAAASPLRKSCDPRRDPRGVDVGEPCYVYRRESVCVCVCARAYVCVCLPVCACAYFCTGFGAGGKKES